MKVIAEDLQYALHANFRRSEITVEGASLYALHATTDRRPRSENTVEGASLYALHATTDRRPRSENTVEGVPASALHGQNRRSEIAWRAKLSIGLHASQDDQINGSVTARLQRRATEPRMKLTADPQVGP